MPTVDVLLHGYSFRTDVGSPGFCSIILIEGQKRTLVDVGHVGRRLPLLAALEQRGLTPADIDLAVMSHAHWDHSQNFDLFQHAPVLIHPWELKYAQRPHKNDWATPAWTGAMIGHHPAIQEVEEGYEIEPGVHVIHSPGHSPGSITVVVETEFGLAVIAGDVLQYASGALTRANPLVFWSEKDATRSITRIVEMADMIYPGHDQPFRVAKGKVEYLEPLKMTIRGMDPDEPGLKYDDTPFPVWIMPGIEEQSAQNLV